MSASHDQLKQWVVDARTRTMELVADLDDSQLMARYRDLVNPLLWEIGHVAWFQEKWALRQLAGMEPARDDADSLYDSAAVPHRTRWDLLLPTRQETLDYMLRVRDRILDRLEKDPSKEDVYHIRYGVFHEDMHCEAFTYTRQTLGFPPPNLSLAAAPAAEGDVVTGDVAIPGGTFLLGASPGQVFVFDNEKWAHEVEVAPFEIARSPVTQGEFARFVSEKGYSRQEFWDEQGKRWINQQGATCPVYWRQLTDGSWERRDFDRWVPLESDHPMIHVNWHEASAFCRWAERRLPSESEWELAASTTPDRSQNQKRLYPWGDEPPDPRRTRMDGHGSGSIPCSDCPDGDSGWGCRQMMGNVWEWTGSVFEPFPGFEMDPYKEYSQPWFGTRRVLRGGSWATRSRMLRNTWRNYFTPDRQDVYAGFRTCSLP